MAYTGRTLKTKLYDVYTKDEADLNIQTNSTPTAVADKDSTSTGYFDLPSGTTAQRPSSPNTGYIRFNTTINLSEYWDGTIWKPVDAPPSLVSISPTYILNTDSSFDITINGQGFSSGATVKAVGQNNTAVTASSVSVVSQSQVVATFDGTQFSDAQEDYDIVVTNQSGLSGTLDDILQVNVSPVWATASGNVGTVIAGNSFSTTVSATDADGDSVAIALDSGALPVGLSVSSGGLISGTESGSDTYASGGVTKSFVLSASDSVNTPVTRSFNIIKKWNDGSTSSQAAASASAIKSLTGTTTMGNYWINLNGTPRLVWCDMSTDGGGWMALWMTPSGGTSSTYRLATDRNDGASSEFENYSLDYGQRSGVRAACSSTQSLVKTNGGWMRFNVYIWNSTTHSSGNYHFHQNCSIVTSNGTSDTSATVAIVNYNNSTGGDFGVAAATNGLDHHSATYYELNSGCSNEYLYQYGMGYKVNTGLSGWSGATAGCTNDNSNDLSLALYMR